MLKEILNFKRHILTVTKNYNDEYFSLSQVGMTQPPHLH